MAVARAGSITAAAGRVNISQPALTYQLKQIEIELGVQLLNRNARGVTLTEAGQVLFDRSAALLESFDAIDQALAPFREEKRRRVVVGMAPTPAKTLAAELIVSGGSRYEIGILESVSDELQQLVLSGEIDCALCYQPLRPGTSITVVPLASEPLFAVAKPGTFGPGKRDTIALADLARLPLVLDSTHQAGRRMIDDLAGRLGLSLDILSAGSVTVKRELISRNNLSTIVPYGLYADELGADQFEARRIVEPAISRTLSLIVAPGRKAQLDGLIRLVSTLVKHRIEAGDTQWQAAVEDEAVSR
jgi:LysR family nitrogen assimilation transcriptional regulator